MSHFDSTPYSIIWLAEEIQHELDIQGTEKEEIELFCDREYYEKYPEELLYYTHPEEIQQKMKDAVMALNKAYVYAQRLDKYLGGDDGPESFLKRLKEELDGLVPG